MYGGAGRGSGKRPAAYGAGDRSGFSDESGSAYRAIGEDGGGRPKAVERRTEAGVAVAEADVKGLIERAARDYNVPSELIDSVMAAESNYNQYAVSPKGAEGLMQLMPATARRFGVKNSFDPKENIEGGVRYLRFLQDTFKDDRLAIAAYNAGEQAVQKYGAFRRIRKRKVT